jgi:hypothetical protein
VSEHVDTICEKCPDGDGQKSAQYIDIIAWNAWIGSWNPSMTSGGDWVKDQAVEMKANHDSRPVWLGNYGYIGADATAEKQVEVIWESGVLDADSSIDSVYYFAAKDVGGGIPDDSNLLATEVGNSTIGIELLKKCASSVSTTTSVTGITTSRSSTTSHPSKSTRLPASTTTTSQPSTKSTIPPASTTTTSTSTEDGRRVGKCGIAVSPGKCDESLGYLQELAEENDLGDVVSKINCMGYGGDSDPCTLNIYEAEAGLNKDPSNCKTGVLFLWDEPYTQGTRGEADWSSPDFVVERWREYATKWSAELKIMRANGLQVTTPLFTNMETASVIEQVDTFFEKCPDCDDQKSEQYIDIIAWNAWIGSWNPSMKSGGDWIKDQAVEMKAKHDSRPVWLGNYGYIGADATADKQVEVIWKSGVLDEDSSIDSVYYFAAQDVGGGIPDGSNVLAVEVGASTIGLELLKKCMIAENPIDAGVLMV